MKPRTILALAAGFVSHWYKIGDQPLQVSLGGRYHAEGPDRGPECGVRAAITLLFPK